ncbi:hypothetical protein KAR91_26475 [Candidatus Pacearchaeota archaeon]|nr:hypothetical protein [Candidatus Pacearchaeota archaeon]
MVKVNNTGKTTAYLPKGKGYYAFKPGINEIELTDLDQITKIQGDKWDNHYSKYLQIIPDEAVVSDDDTEKSVKQLKEIIGGMDADELILLEDSEKERADGPRSTVLTMIEKAMKKLDETPDGENDSADGNGDTDINGE